ncbi:MAG: hypothetical protein IPJ19_00655 [Planctomycetes bacterium]|nr:hypothetical protein [Planctomycetota bacterium]
MSLSKKTLAFLALSIAAFLGATLWTLDRLVTSKLARVEREQMSAEVADARALLVHCAREYGERLSGWSDWDPMAEFLRDGNQAFLDQNVQLSTLRDELHADVFVIARDEGAPVYSGQLDAARGSIQACSNEFLEQLTPAGLMRPGAAFTGLLALSEHSYIVSSRPIHTTAGADGPVPGRLVAAREIDPAWLQNLHELSSLALELRRTSEAPADELEHAAREALASGAGSFVAQNGEHWASAYGTLPDLYGRPTLVLHVARESSVRQGGREILRGVLLTLVAGGMLLGIGLFLAARRALVDPVERLLGCTRRLWRGERSHVILRSGDELEALASDINRMTDAVFEIEEAIQNAHAGPADTTAPALPGQPAQYSQRPG